METTYTYEDFLSDWEDNHYWALRDRCFRKGLDYDLYIQYTARTPFDGIKEYYL